ncbi:MAG: trypsin-like peptidase domain-containing protein [Clostridia bacterium]|nr:trypsin-like peptidase domain-containing protein [Clostridia bacterium]
MDYEYNNNNKKSGGTAIVCVVLTMVIILGLTVGAFGIYRNANTDYSEQITQMQTELEAKYSSQISELETTVSKLEQTIKNQQSVSNISSSVIAGSIIDSSVSIQDIADSVKPSIVAILVNVPSTRYQIGFFSYNVGGISTSGTGIILNDDGYIVTNYHVVSYFDQYENVTIDVVLSDGTEYSAEFIGGDENNDLAVVKIIPDKDIKPAILGSSEALRVGEVVLAVGNPLGIEFAGSVTMGIVSALDRTISEENTAETMIQTDAAINPGNSGGALVNTNGEVIGITTLKVSDTDVEGLGFAIPIDYAEPIISDLIEYGYVKDRPATGITGSTVSKTISRYYGVPQGIIVTEVEENSGAYLAGIEKNDIITEIDGVAVESMADIQDVNSTHKVGDIIVVTFYRNGNYYTANLILMEDRGR